MTQREDGGEAVGFGLGEAALCVVGCLGSAIGAVVAAVGGRAIASQLYGVSPLDPLTFAVVIALLLACACLAALLPALRATRVDPSTALHYE